jgi:hypothetical protein
MQVHIGDLPADPTFLQRVQHRELSDVSSEKLAKKLAALQSSAWDLPALKWHFSRHRVQAGVSTETEYAKLAEDVLGNPTRIFSEIYVDPFTVQRYGLGRLLSWEREEKIEQICDSLPRSWIFVDERAGGQGGCSFRRGKNLDTIRPFCSKRDCRLCPQSITTRSDRDILPGRD